ncbi:unnamed protein product [Cutaneotrichosporon oleaginosum]
MSTTISSPDSACASSSLGRIQDHDISQEAITMVHNWVLRAPHVTDIWIHLACPPEIAFRIYGEVLTCGEIPSWLIPGAEDRRSGLMRRLRNLLPRSGSDGVVHWSICGKITVEPLPNGGFHCLLNQLRDPPADQEPAISIQEVSPVQPRNSTFFPVFAALAGSIAQAAWEWATTPVETVWVCLADVNGVPRSTVLFEAEGCVRAPEAVGEDLEDLQAVTLMEWRDFVTAGVAGTHHPGMVVIRMDRSTCKIIHTNWRMVGEMEVTSWAEEMQANGSNARCEGRATPRARSPGPSSRPLLLPQGRPVSPPHRVGPASSTSGPETHAESTLPPPAWTPTPDRGTPPPNHSRQAAFLNHFQASLATILRAILAWPVERRNVLTMWVYLTHLNGTAAACILMDDGVGTSLAALGGRSPARLLETVGSAWACTAATRRVALPMGVVLIVRPNAGPSLTVETSWKRGDVEWPEVRPDAVWRRSTSSED